MATGGALDGHRPLTGTMEIWLEPVLDGVLLHYFLHAEPAGVAAWELAKMNLAKITHRRRVAGKADGLRGQDHVEAARPVGVAPGTDIGSQSRPGRVPFLRDPNDGNQQ